MDERAVYCVVLRWPTCDGRNHRCTAAAHVFIRSVQYYRLNGVNIGEFAAFANWSGLNGVPTIFLAGDDKAALEARMFIPKIETVVSKLGKGLEASILPPRMHAELFMKWPPARYSG